MGDTSLRRASGVLARVRKSGSTLPGRRIPAAMLSLWTSSPRWVVLFMAGPPYVARAAGLSRDQSTNPCGRGRPLESVHMMTRHGEGDLALQPEVLEEAAIVAHDHRGPGIRSERPLELLDGGDVELVGGLVQQQAVGLSGRQQCQPGPSALPRREGVDGAFDMPGGEVELGEQAASAFLEQTRSVLELRQHDAVAE